MEPSKTKTRTDRAKHGYGRRWNVKSQAFLARTDRLCVWRHKYPETCLGIATVVDHINGFGKIGDRQFWDKRNWQPMCVRCHGRKTKQEQTPVQHDASGMPIDPDHHWNREE